MHLKKITILLVFISCTVSLHADNGGSIYTRYGLGDLRYFPSGRSAGFAGVSTAIISNYSINRLNPAAWTGLSRTRYEISGMYEGIFTSDRLSSAYFSKMTFEGFMISFPILPSRGVTLSGGIVPFSRVKYEVVNPAIIESLEFENRYIGEGGLSVGQIGGSALIGSDLHFGAKINYYFGSLSYTTKQKFAGSIYTSAEVLRSTYLRGIGYTLGGIFTGLGNLLNIPETSSLNVGFIFSAASTLKPTEEKYYIYDNQIIRSYDTLIIEGDGIHFPVAVGGGISYTTERLLIGSDFYFQDWSSSTVPETPELRNVLRISLGTELLAKRDPSLSPLRRAAYRAGVYYNSTYYKINNHKIDEIGLTAGIGFAVLGDTRLDLGLDFSLRGTTDGQMQRDNILRLTISLAGGEPWFVRPVQD